MTAINAKMVNDYFGIGTFGAFQFQREVGKRLAAHYERRLKQAFSPNDDGLSFRLGDIGYIGASAELAFEHVSAGKKVNENQFWPVYQLYEAAVASAQAESDHLDAVFAAGFLPMLGNLVKQFPLRELKSAAEAERKALLELDSQLDSAKSQRRGAIFDKALDIGLLLVPFTKEVAEIHFRDNLGNWRERVFNVQNQLARVKKSLDESARGVEDQRTDYWNLQQKSGYKRYLIWKIDR